MSVSEPPKLLSPDERRKLYFDEYQDRVDRHRSGSAFYEQRAIELATNGFKILPTSMAVAYSSSRWSCLPRLTIRARKKNSRAEPRARNKNRDLAHKKLRQSDFWRIASLFCVWLSLLLFIGGALLGGAAVVHSK
jgi:hypothetical protein